MGKSGAVYFNSKGIDNLTGHTITRDSLLETLSAIDPGAQYTKLKNSVYLRTMVHYYEDAEKRTRLYELIERIAKAANEADRSDVD